MTAFHTMILFSDGAPLTPAGGSSCSLTDTQNMGDIRQSISMEVKVITTRQYYAPGWWSMRQDLY